MNRLLVVPTILMVAVAAVTIVACASKASAPGTSTPTLVPGTSGQPSGTVSTTTPGATASGDPSAQQYIVYHDDTGAIAVRDLESGKTYRQTVDANTEVITQTRCAQDGQNIAYLKQLFAEATKRQIIVRGANALPNPLSVDSLVQWIAWSRDGKKLAIVEWNGQNKNGKIEILDVASGQIASTIMDGDQYIGNIAWSPSDDRLAFYLQTSDFSRADIYTMQSDGSALTRLTPGDGSKIWLDPAWSPDGKWIVAAGAEAETVQLYRIEADGSGITQLTTSTDIYKRNPYFSPDGKIIAYTGSVVLPGVSLNYAALHQFAIFVMNPDGTAEHALTADPRGTTPGPNDQILNAYMLGWCKAGPWLDDLWTPQ
ncbi:MAG: hypothetical protein ABI559_03475 [Chloroflexota bacterium]